MNRQNFEQSKETKSEKVTHMFKDIPDLHSNTDELGTGGVKAPAELLTKSQNELIDATNFEEVDFRSLFQNFQDSQIAYKLNLKNEATDGY